MADDQDVGAALTGWLAQFAQRNNKPLEVIEGYTPDLGQRILDRRNDQTIIPDMGEFQPRWKNSLVNAGVPQGFVDPIYPNHTSTPLAKALGYNDIKKPSPEEMAKFLADISEMDKIARAQGPDMSAEDLKTMNDPIGKWLRRDE